jgi:RNA-binding protein
MTLTSKQRAHLRSLAHSLKPVAHIGQAGLTPAALQSVQEAFNTRELLKVKVQDGAPASPYETADRLVATIPGVHVAQTIGRIVVLYRPFEEDPEIRLP